MSKITIPDNSILLLEGGSLRGLFTAGVLDTFMENDVYFPGPEPHGGPPASTCATATTAGISAPRRRCAAAACLA